MGVAVWLEAHKQNDFRYRPAQDATAVARFGELSAAAVLQLLVPLLIILLGFSAFAGERDLGTLRQLLSLGVRPRDLAAGKALGVASALGLLLVPAGRYPRHQMGAMQQQGGACTIGRDEFEGFKTVGAGDGNGAHVDFGLLQKQKTHRGDRWVRSCFERRAGLPRS